MDSNEWLWDELSAVPALGADEVHIWSVDLDRPAAADGLLGVLSVDERERAERYGTDELRNRFVRGRGVLRQLLGVYLGVAPSVPVFHYGMKGKPELEGELAGALHFNLSHTAGVGLIAVARKHPVGVDVERVRSVWNPGQIAERFFTPTESAELEALPDVQRAPAFFHLWTRKEAWLKATGDGIGEALDRVEMSFLPGEPERVVQVDGQPEEAGQWTLAGLLPATGFVGALAVRARNLNIRCGHRVK